MKRFLTFISFYAFLFLLVSFAGKVIFIAYQWQLIREIPFLEIGKALLIGLRLDVSLMAYFSIIICGIYMFLFWNSRILKLCIDILTFVLIALLSLVIIADCEIYRNWLTHIDASVFQYLKTPSEAMASTTVFLITLLLISWMILSLLFVWLYLKISSRIFTRTKNSNWKVVPVGIIVIALLIIPMRGSLGVAPINTGTVFFSTNPTTNHIAVNPSWNFIYSLGKLDVLDKNYQYMESSKADEIFQKIQSGDNHFAEELQTKHPNVIIIMMESLSARITSSIGGRYGITPRFDSLVNEGLLFSRMNAASYRTDKGLVAVLCGYPAQPLNSIIKFPQKTQHLPFISRSLAAEGYSSTFVYGGDKNFSNINSLLLNGGFNHIVDLEYYNDTLPRNKWGVADECVMNKAIEVLDTTKGKFFCLMLTQSNHEPFDVPAKPKFKGIDDSIRYFNTAYYADSCLGFFIDKAKTKPWWNNTLVIIVADHSSRLPGNLNNTQPERYHIPMLWLGGALKTKGKTIPWTCAQTDIASTLLSQMAINNSGFKFSSNILDTTRNHFALFTYYDGFGMLTDLSQQVFDNDSRSYILNKGTSDSLWGKAYWQVANDDFLRK